jgi:hypothetical protein
MLILISVLQACGPENPEKPDGNLSDSLSLIDSNLIPNKIDSQGAPTNVGPDFSIGSADFKRLNLYYRLPPGTSFKTIHAVYPSIKGIKPENNNNELAQQGLTMAEASDTFMRRKAMVRFHFRNDSLYRYEILLSSSDLKECEGLYQAISAYYTNQIGAPIKREVEEDSHYEKSKIWDNRPDILFCTYYMNKGLVEFGLQTNPNPL